MSTTEQYPDFTGMTFEKVWAALMESRRSFEEWKQSQVEADAKWKQANAEADARLEKMIQENRQSAEESTRRLEKLHASLSEQQKETDKQIKRTDKQLGNLGNRMGEVIEHLITAGAIPRFNAMGYHFTKASTRVKIFDPKTDRTRAEADVVLENGEAVIIVEVKTEPTISDVQQHIRRLQIFREDRDKSAPNDDKKIFGAIAAAVFPDEVQDTALSAGFYVIMQSGDNVKIAVPEGFVPTAF